MNNYIYVMTAYLSLKPIVFLILKWKNDDFLDVEWFGHLLFIFAKIIVKWIVDFEKEVVSLLKQLLR